ncbi:MAG: hypothetical protein AAFV53_25085 [Myxococcota bacterium]
MTPKTGLTKTRTDTAVQDEDDSLLKKDNVVDDPLQQEDLQDTIPQDVLQDVLNVDNAPDQPMDSETEGDILSDSETEIMDPEIVKKDEEREEIAEDIVETSQDLDEAKTQMKKKDDEEEGELTTTM